MPSFLQHPWCPSKAALIALACAVVLAIGVPFAGTAFEAWPVWLGIIWAMSFLVLPIASLIGTLSAADAMMSGIRQPKQILSLVICLPSIVLALILFLTFTQVIR